jgi:hypothetical protein
VVGLAKAGTSTPYLPGGFASIEGRTDGNCTKLHQIAVKLQREGKNKCGRRIRLFALAPDRVHGFNMRGRYVF